MSSIVLILIGVWMAQDLIRTEIGHARWSRAHKAHSLMMEKLYELLHDPTMTSRKWLEWLPIFEYADQYYATNNYFLKIHATSLGDRVKQEIDPTFLKRA